MALKISVLTAALALLTACHSSPTAASGPAAAAAKPTSGQVYGAALTADGALPISELGKVLGTQDSAQMKLVGTATGVCQAKGCWLTMQTADGKEMRVRFKDYAFFVPKDLTGKTVVINGWAHREQVPVKDLRHYARDAGKSDQEVAAITRAEDQLNFEADGVLVKK